MASLEFWSALFNGAVVILTGLLAVAGYFAWKYSSDLSALKDEALRQFQVESTERSKTLSIALEQQRERAANAERELLEVKRKVAPRVLKQERFLELLRGKPVAPVEILFLKDDPEVFELTMQIRDLLKIAKWDCKDPQPIPVTWDSFASLSSTMGVGGQPAGITLVVRMVTARNIHDEPPQPHDWYKDPDWFKKQLPNPPLWALHDALMDSLGRMHLSEHPEIAPAAGIIRIVVGPKPPSP